MDNNRTLAGTSNILVNIIEVEGIEQRVDCANLVYNGRKNDLPISMELADKLSKGDKVFAVFNDNSVVMVYCPVEEDKLYVP